MLHLIYRNEFWYILLRQKEEQYVEEMKFNGSVFLTMVTSHGVRRNAYWNDIQSEVTLDDLFE